MGQETHVKYGGVKFTNNVPPQQINDFVRNLPEEKKESLFTVMKELQEAGLITIEEGQLSTIDEDELLYYKIPNAHEKGEWC